MTDFASEYRGWHICRWTDWKEGASDFLAAQWLARKGEGEAERFLYASTPGAAAEYRRGDTFDVTRLPGQEIVTLESPDEVRASEQLRTYQRLQQLIDNVEALGAIASSVPLLACTYSAQRNCPIVGHDCRRATPVQMETVLVSA
jgi:hypothetical protein